MKEINFQKYYSKSLAGHSGYYHFAAHSHHLWPDTSLDAQIEAWNDGAKFSDKKWDKIFSEVIPDVQGLIADILKLKHPERIVFAPNTHELVNRVISIFPTNNEMNVLTTSSEFYSFARQISRYEEESLFNVKRISTESIFQDRKQWVQDFISEMKTKKFDLIFLSAVFFDSGFAFTNSEIEEIVSHKANDTIFILDGYHGFCALPFDLSKVENKIFFVAGGYKYAQAGEGVCFMVVPEGNWRPANTGWFASFTTLHQSASQNVGYGDHASAFWGGTFDPTGLYRFRAVWNQFKSEGITVNLIHDHVKLLQSMLLRNYENTETELLYSMPDSFDWHGHFLTFKASDETRAEELSNKLNAAKIWHDRRGIKIRIGFGLYHTPDDVLYLIRNLCL